MQILSVCGDWGGGSSFGPNLKKAYRGLGGGSSRDSTPLAVGLPGADLGGGARGLRPPFVRVPISFDTFVVLEFRRTVN